MFNRKIFRGIALCTLSAVLLSQLPSTVLADEEQTQESIETIEGTGEAEVTPEPDQQTQEIESTDSTTTTDPTDPSNGDPDNEEKVTEPDEEEIKEVLPISAAISVSGEAGNLTLVLTLTNATFVTENPIDFKAAFADVPEGVSIDVIAQTDNTVTYHIHGNVVNYTKSDLHMAVPAFWLKNTADEVVETETALEEHDLYWCAHADFGIRLKSKAETVDNATFIAQQNLTENQLDYDNFRFVYKEMELKCFADKTDILEYPSEDARIVGQALWNQAVYEIIGIEDGWVYVESGDVRGFVRKEEVVSPEENQKILKYNTAKLLIPASENKAYDFVRITGYSSVIKEIPRITTEDLEIKEEKKKDSKTVGTIQKNGLVFYLSSEDKGWVYVESGDVRGFVENKALLSAKDSTLSVKQKGKAAFPQAVKTVDSKDNKALYYKAIFIKSGTLEDFYRDQIVELAKKYIGNPYVYGGTDPVNGIDCSAFMQFLFGSYGISLPRTSKTQGFVGTMVTMGSIDKGDMIIYADDAEIYHVVLYAGDGKTVEAADETQGILSKDVNSVAAVWGISLLDQTESLIMPSEIGKPSYVYETQEAYENRLEEEKKGQ